MKRLPRFTRPLVLGSLLISVASTAHAAASPLVGFDAMSQTIMTKGQSSFAGVGVRARLQSERIIKQVEFMPGFEYWRNTSNVQPYDIKASRKDATLAFDTRYNFNAVGGWKPYLGAGWALHFISGKVDAPSLGINDVDDSLIKGGMAALAGGTIPISDRIENILEVKYHFLSDMRQFKFNWGLAFKL